jgi:hypothetical protein
MRCQANHERDSRLATILRSAAPAGLELSLVDLVLLACDASGDDEGDVDGLVANAIASGAARILPRDRDPMLIRRPEAAGLAA